MLNRFKSLIFIVIVVFLNGCTSTSPSVKAKQIKQEIPSWITTPKNSTSKYMYGVSIGVDRQSAIKSALVNMVSKLGVSIESSFQSKQEVHNYYENNLVINNIKANVSKIKVSNYEVVKSQQIGYKEFAVMIKTDKRKFLNGLDKEIKSKEKSMKFRLNSLKEEDILRRYNVKKMLSLEVDFLKANIIVLSELDKKYDAKKYFDFIDRVKQEFIEEQKRLSFYVYGDKKSIGFVNDIKNYLTKQGFRLSSTKTITSVLVQLRTIENIEKNSYMSIAVLKVDINVYNKGKKVGGNYMILKERYKEVISNVYKNASIHFRQDIESSDIEEVLGINLK